MKIKYEVTSSAIKAIAYDKDTKILEVTFTQGKTYDYPGVPESEVLGLLNADSVGRYFNTHIKKYSIAQ